MPSILTIIGSPRKNGNTVYLSKLLREQLSDLDHAGAIFLHSMDIRPCSDCRGCKQGDLVCVVKDEMQTLYPCLDRSDILVIGTPIYWFGPTAQTKLFIDRLRPYYGNKKLSGKKAALLLPAGSGATDCDLTVDMFRRIFDALDIEWIGYAPARAYDIGEAASDEHAKAAVKNIAGAIAGPRPQPPSS